MENLMVNVQELWQHFHFLRPQWLLVLPMWAALIWMFWVSFRQHSGWSALCDAPLLQYLTGESTKPQKRLSWLLLPLLAGSLAILAMAGPVFKQLPQPVMQSQAGMVLVLDLSASMLAEDVKPNRLIRAKQKIQDILDIKKEGQSGLVVFAATAFDVVPLTSDSRAITALLNSLQPSMMPAQGSIASQGLEHAAAMLKRSGVTHGSIILLSDGVDMAAEDVAARIRQQGHRISVLAIGTADGAPIPSVQGNFIHDASGQIVLARLNLQQLANVADAGGGLFRQLRIDDKDIRSFPGITSTALDDAMQGMNRLQSMQTDQWREEGHWLLLLILPILALLFRRGALLSLTLLLMGLPVPQAEAMDWQDLWQRPDQQGMHLLQNKQAEQAATTFENPDWKAAALYRAGKYEEAAKVLQQQKGAQNAYNRGNALAKAGKLEQAVKAYQQALAEQPELEDAKFNLELVQKLLQQQQAQSSDEQQDKKNSDEQKSDQNKQDNQQQQSGSSGEKQSGQHADKQPDQQSGQQSQQDDKQQNTGDKQASSQQQDDMKQNEHNMRSGKSSDDKNKPEQEQAKQMMQQDEKTKDDAHQKDKQAMAQEKTQQDAQDMEVYKAQQQWLRRIPDDPGGLLRRKFRYQYQQQQPSSTGGQAW